MYIHIYIMYDGIYVLTKTSHASKVLLWPDLIRRIHIGS